MERTLPPFRADHIGSLVRPSWLIAARQDFNAGKITRDEALQRIEVRVF